jgi:acyl dehydratase
MKIIQSLGELKTLLNQEVSVSEWIVVTQDKIDQFAQATGDQQWIHVDPERASKGPFKTTIAHGFLTLSMIPQMISTALTFPPSGMAINYGLNKVRFTKPVPVNSKIRGRFFLSEIETLSSSVDQKEIGFQMNWRVTIEQEGETKPVCIAESITRRYAEN